MTERLMFPPFAAAVRLPSGQWRVIEPEMPLLSAWHIQMLVWLAVTVLLAAPAAFFLARRLTRPIRVFAQAAERLGADPHAPPLVAEGPLEVRQAAEAFNEMQVKIRRYVQDRTSMVAAIAHDLRTPLTRLRFRIESAPEDARRKAAEDIAEMDGMIAAALAYVRGEGAGEARVPLDLAALCRR